MKSSKAQANSKLKITMYWGDILYESGLYGKNSKVFVGRTADSDFLIDRDKLKIVEVFPDNTAELQFDGLMDGHIRLGDEVISVQNSKDNPKVKSLPNGMQSLKISSKDKADLVFEHVSFNISWVQKPDTVKRFEEIPVKKVGLTSLVLMLFFLIPIIITTSIEKEEPEKPPERVVTLLPKKQAKAAAGQMKSATGGGQAGDAGQAQAAPPKPPTAAEVLKSSNLGNLISNISNLGKSAPQVNTENKNTAQEVVNMAEQGSKGFSTEGLKKGGGGKTVGIGRTVGQGEGGFEGTGKLGLSGNSLVEGSSGYGEQSYQVEGGLDKDVIDAIIRKRQDAVRLCYERQLNFYPTLSGKIAVQFVIGKRGEVLSANAIEDTMHNASVASCLINEVRSWNFPPPRGGTLVKIEYPFVFESSAKK
jgi:hypothetical protein